MKWKVQLGMMLLWQRLWSVGFLLKSPTQPTVHSPTLQPFRCLFTIRTDHSPPFLIPPSSKKTFINTTTRFNILTRNEVVSKIRKEIIFPSRTSEEVVDTAAQTGSLRCQDTGCWCCGKKWTGASITGRTPQGLLTG